MHVILRKWGNSVGVRLPSSVLKEAHLRENQHVTVIAKEGTIVITPTAARRYRLSTLLAEVTPKNRHKATDFDGPVGKELL
jgi:antitoxin MazE